MSTISKELLGRIVDQVFDGCCEDTSAIEEIYALVCQHHASAVDTRQFRRFAAALDAESIRPEIGAWKTTFTAAAMTIRHLSDHIDQGFRPARIPPRAVRVGPETYAYQADEENPGWTEQDFANAKPAYEVLPEVFGKQEKVTP